MIINADVLAALTGISNAGYESIDVLYVKSAIAFVTGGLPVVAIVWGLSIFMNQVHEVRRQRERKILGELQRRFGDYNVRPPYSVQKKKGARRSPRFW
jgi:hypothetical protein